MVDEVSEADPKPEEEPFDRALPALMVFHGLVGESVAMQRVYRKIVRYGPALAPVLITGETGTGKELVVRAVHATSPRQDGPLVALNCAAVNEDLFLSELFGHEKGAFTGAIQSHHGRFERADGGTLFLDEVGDMPLQVQATLLRALEHGTFERVGGERELKADVRVVAATNVPLERAIRQGTFRADLFHRVAVLRIHVPPLREREGDLPLLVEHFLRFFNSRYGRRVRGLSPEALRVLEAYSWPGNVRELRNVLERVYVETRTEVIGRSALKEWERERELVAAGSWDLNLRDEQRFAGPALIVPSSGSGGPRVLPYHGDPHALPPPPPGTRILDVRPLASVDVDDEPDELTEERLREAYSRAGGNLTKAARLLGVHKTTVYRTLKRLGLTRDDLDAPDEDSGAEQ